MSGKFCLDTIYYNIKNEDDLINIFDNLIKEGLNPIEACSFITDKYGEEILEILDDNTSTSH
ncbi:MAG: hypothetical protein WCR78_05965 [Arcobacteraceae bacterium]